MPKVICDIMGGTRIVVSSISSKVIWQHTILLIAFEANCKLSYSWCVFDMRMDCNAYNSHSLEKFLILILEWPY